MIQPKGIIPPIVTPMLANEDVDCARLEVWIDHLLSRGVHGIFVLGTTGECYSLDESEKQKIIATAVAHVAGRVPVYAGTGAETTREAVRLTGIAHREGASGVSVITPYFISPSQSELADHYRRIAEAVQIPILLYNNPSTTGGIKLEPETVAKLAGVPGIVGIKDSTGDMQHFNEIVRLVPDTFSVLQGRDTLIWHALMSGAKGAIPATCNFAVDYCVGIYEAFRTGDRERAQEFQRKLAPVRIAMALGTAPGTVKAALAAMGESVGPSRSPIAPLPPAQTKRLVEILTEAGLMGHPTPDTHRT